MPGIGRLSGSARRSRRFRENESTTSYRNRLEIERQRSSLRRDQLKSRDRFLINERQRERRSRETTKAREVRLERQRIRSSLHRAQLSSQESAGTGEKSLPHPGKDGREKLVSLYEVREGVGESLSEGIDPHEGVSGTNHPAVHIKVESAEDEAKSCSFASKDNIEVEDCEWDQEECIDTVETSVKIEDAREMESMDNFPVEIFNREGGSGMIPTTRVKSDSIDIDKAVSGSLANNIPKTDFDAVEGNVPSQEEFVGVLTEVFLPHVKTENKEIVSEEKDPLQDDDDMEGASDPMDLRGTDGNLNHSSSASDFFQRNRFLIVKENKPQQDSSHRMSLSSKDVSQLAPQHKKLEGKQVVNSLKDVISHHQSTASGQVMAKCFVVLNVNQSQEDPALGTLPEDILQKDSSEGQGDIRFNNTNPERSEKNPLPECSLPNKCNVCGKCFMYPSMLTVHGRMHSGVKPYKCRKCPKLFAKLGNLKSHENVHLGVRPFKCDKCNGAFSYKSALQIHMRVHAGERPYKCKMCKGRFAQKITLNEHIRTHTGDKPYVCDKCNARFSQKGNLETHKKIHV